MKKILFINVLYFSLIANTFSQNKDYEIYSILLNDKEINWTNKNTALIFSKTVKHVESSDVLLELKANLNGVPDYMDSYLDENLIKVYNSDENLRLALLGLLKGSKNSIKIDSFINPQFKLKLINKRNFESFFKKDINEGWNQINKKYQSNLVVEFSKVSFSGKYAAVYYRIYCGGLCGSGDIFVFENRNNKWFIISTINLIRG
ncbi:hypothetical protein H1R17_00700 [Flavobacterium sp. xlx-214]|uniref:hypothetical protein n=1 Tax=unclassified Flavobacterium TaxID=196869 RepID=UPI0013CF4EE9|nr:MULTISPECIES: hypothetical protein [unclassified Flavobacterium]MBA5794070.1 hypothetical protein [Flavobacterium sp. xlx-221]QMI83695.1 hypothetical protein H1R17_00700 [Flavobacterium sp. xlx-214]